MEGGFGRDRDGGEDKEGAGVGMTNLNTVLSIWTKLSKNKTTRKAH